MLDQQNQAVNTAQKANGIASTTASATEAGKNPGHVSQPSALTTTNKRQKVVNENQFEKIIALLRSKKYQPRAHILP